MGLWDRGIQKAKWILKVDRFSKYFNPNIFKNSSKRLTMYQANDFSKRSLAEQINGLVSI